MTIAVLPRFTRRRIDRSKAPVPLAFVFDDSLVQPEHVVAVVDWTGSALQTLRDLRERFANLEPRRDLPVEALRGRLQVGDADNLRLDRNLGLRGPSSTLLWTACAADEACKRVGRAVLGWLVDDVVVHNTPTRELVQRLKQFARDGKLLNATRRTAWVFAWEQTRTGTTLQAETNCNGYEDLADFVACRLEGQEILPGLGGLRRIVSGRLDLNQAELLTEPVLDQATPFSLVVRVRVLSFPGRATPVVVFDLSRRIWTRMLEKATVKELSGYALPDGIRTALRFTLRRRRTKIERGYTYTYQPDTDFAPIARAFGLPLDMSGDEIAAGKHPLPGCRLFVVHKHGVGERVKVKYGVPDLDKMVAFRHAGEIFAPHGLRPWEGLAEIPSATRAVKDRNQKWRNRNADEGRHKAFEQWREEAKADIAACYTGMHHIVVAHYGSCYNDAVRARSLLDEMLGSHVCVQLIPIPHNVHGSRAMLPQPSVKAPRNHDYAALRTQAWKPFVAEVQRYRDEVGERIDGILVIAPEWYDGVSPHDDPVNKRAGRITLARELGLPIQYLRPEQEDGHQRQAESFENRLMMAWRDLAWKTIGRVSVDKLTAIMAQVYGAAPTDGAPAVPPPDRVLAVGILRRNRTRLANEQSFVPFAIELDVERGTCSARFARERGQSYEITPLLSLPEALVELASSGPIQLATDRTNRSKQRQERSQHFFHAAITDFCQRAERPLILIDAVACRGVWPWVADTRIDPENVVIGEHLHAEADWGNVRIVRVRTQNAPKVLFDGYFEGTCAETGKTVRYDAPKWAEAQLFKLTDTQADVYLSFGALLRTDLVRGSSCYREVDGLKRHKGKPMIYTREPIEIFTKAWSTPSAVEFTVVRKAAGERSEQVAQVVEWLRTLYAHFGDWSTKPAPLYFENALKEYLADYDLDEEEDDSEDGEE